MPETTTEEHPDTPGKEEFSTEYFRNRLSAEEFRILRQAGTEPAFSGHYWDHFQPGVYCCRGCDAELFSAEAKFDAGCGWPSYWQPSTPDALSYHEDTSLGMVRTEVRCARCGSHLGHVFRGEGFPTPTDARFCINSACLQFRPAGDAR